MEHTPLLLAILDGLALNPNPESNAFVLAKTPVLDKLLSEYPHTTLQTHGPHVGLPNQQMGNSEVGHLNIGAGRVVMQDLTKINKISEEESFDTISQFNTLINSVHSENGSLHLIGLVSTGGVHSNIEHLLSLLKSINKTEIKQVYVHVITDGRDRPPQDSVNEIPSLIDTIQELNQKNSSQVISIASICGRYYAMDRDKRWERTQLAYDCYFKGSGEKAESAMSAISSAHERGEKDEFIKPIHLGDSESTIKENDGVIFFNFRADRMRQIVAAFSEESFDGFTRTHPIVKHCVTFTEYDETFTCPSLFPPEIIKNHLGEVLSKSGLRQLRIAETEKYPHVTYFLSGGSEEVLDGEEREVVPSPRDVATYDLKPEMSALEITDTLLQRLSNEPPVDVIILNFANCDMVGHTGNLDAAIKAVETVDTCLGKILEKIEALGGTALITADHGNADQMVDYDTGGAHTYHTTYPVPFIVFGAENVSELKSGGALCDIAPTMLALLDIVQPKEMTGTSLI